MHINTYEAVPKYLKFEDWKSLTDLYQTQLQSHNFYLNIMEH